MKLEKTLRSNGESLELVQEEADGLELSLDECGEYLDKLKAEVERAQEVEDKQKEDLDVRKKELGEKEEEVEGFRKKQVSFSLHRVASLSLTKKPRWS